MKILNNVGHIIRNKNAEFSKSLFFLKIYSFSTEQIKNLHR
jgi:hypothetical protein